MIAVWDEVLGREVACKLLASGASSTAFLREARATARLQHPGIVPVYDLGRRPDGTPFYTMKYLRGRTLSAAIHARKSLKERLELLGAFVDICQAVAYAHNQGVIHRDLKPANVMVGEFGETVVLDWGLARISGEAEPARTQGIILSSSDSSPLTLAGAVLGTPAYMAPEQAAGVEVDRRADIWPWPRTQRSAMPTRRCWERKWTPGVLAAGWRPIPTLGWSCFASSSPATSFRL